MILALKLLLTPLFMAAASLAGRRWGPVVSGWLIGFPLTSAPVSIILASQNGTEFAAQAAIGTLGGLASVCAFCLAYRIVAQRANWLLSLALAIVAFAIATLVWDRFTLSLLPTCGIVLLVIALLIRLSPDRVVPSRAAAMPGWDIPARMVIATGFVITLTTLSSVLGPQLSGLLSPFPIFAIVLAAFTHRQQGPQAAIQALRGLTWSSLGFAGFFVAVGALLSRIPLVSTYIIAAIVAIAVNGISLHLARRNSARLYQQGGHSASS